MAAPRSRYAIVGSLVEWAKSLKPRDLGIRGKVVFVSSDRSSVIIRVQDDHEQEVIDYKITVREHLEGAK